ncbi:MAG: GAF domain-containing protein, partial [Granulosicoccus sp.]|nr:GAF domain-containing protein [Granulosicoccus sp.]
LAAILLLLFAWFFATKSFRPVSDLMAGADRVAQGVLTQPVPVRSGDELGVLAKSFNAMANELQSSYTNLEQKIDERTRELARSVEELKALGKISQAVNSTLDLEEVLSAIVEQAVGLSEADGGAIYQFIDQSNTLELRAASQLDETLVEVLRDSPLKMDEGAMSQSISLREPVQLTSASDVQLFHNLVTVRSALESSGIQALLVLPLMNKNQPVGGLIVARRAAGNYTPKIVALLESFAMQSAIAIQNARLYNQLWEKSTELELASQHKSQFLANMSHELRTPLNAIIGYTELVQDSIYGDVPDKVHEVLERVHKNGQHLLGLINSVLDLSKIEAGLFTLQLEEYSMPDIIRNALATVESLAAEKQLKLITDIEPELPMGKGDEQRLLQVLLNLVGNAIKFTNTGEVSVNAMLKDELFYVAVSDTGPGIGEEDQLAIFDEFQQVDNSSTREQGGTGLGLAITKKIILMHGGEIGVHSSIGNGSTFWFRIPLQVNHQREAA